MSKWLRKNSFIKDLRLFLHQFKIVEMAVEVSDEARFNGETIDRTGRQIITIKLTGYWKGKNELKAGEQK